MHCLVKLSSTEFRLYKANSILLEGITKSVDEKSHTLITTYSNVTYGDRVRTNNVYHNSDHTKKRLDLSRMKSKYVFILASRDECMKQFPNMFIHSSSLKEESYHKKNKRQNGSGYVVLSFVILQHVMNVKALK